MVINIHSTNIENYQEHQRDKQVMPVTWPHQVKHSCHGGTKCFAEVWGPSENIWSMEERICSNEGTCIVHTAAMHT